MTAHEFRLYHRLQVSAHVLRKLADRMVEPLGFTTGQLAVVAVIAQDQPTTQTNIAKVLALNESGLTALLSRLVADGIVERRQSEDDKRVRLLSLTEAGLDLQNQARSTFGKVNELIDQALPESTQSDMALALDELRIAAEEDLDSQ